MLKQAYWEGYAETCQAYGADPLMVKQAVNSRELVNLLASHPQLFGTLAGAGLGGSIGYGLGGGKGALVGALGGGSIGLGGGILADDLIQRISASKQQAVDALKTRIDKDLARFEAKLQKNMERNARLRG